MILAVVASALLASPPLAVTKASTAAAPAAVGGPCDGALDSIAPSATSPGCPSPASMTSTVPPDAKTSPAPPRRDPSILPGELGFVSVVVGLVGGGAMLGAQVVAPRQPEDDAVGQRRAVFVTGASLVGLAGLVGAGAVATVVFDPSTGTLRLPLFAGED